MTAGRIILPLSQPALDRNGKPYSGAKLHFYQNGTTIEQNVFSDATLGTELSNPVLCDGAGRFPEIWADITDLYSVTWNDPDNALLDTFDDIYPTGADVGVDGAGVSAAAFRTALGLGTSALEDSGTSGHTLPFCDGENTFSEPQHFTVGSDYRGEELGYIRIPPLPEDADYTLILTDAAKGLIHTSATGHTWTIPTHASVGFVRGTAVSLRNSGTGVVTIARSAGVELRIAGSATNADASLASYGAAALVQEDINIWYIMGVGLS